MINIPIIDPGYKSLNFVNASIQYLSMSDSDFGAYTYSKFSISLWFKTNVTTGNLGLYSQYTSGGTGSFRITKDTNKIRVDTVHDITGSLTNTFIGATALSTGTWYHLLVHIDPTNATSGNRIKVWLNGSPEAAGSYSVPENSAVYDSNVDVLIGYYGSGAWDGLIYQPAFFDNVLVSTSDVTNSGHPINDISGVAGLKSDITGKNNSIVNDLILTPDWTNNNGVTSSTDKPT